MVSTIEGLQKIVADKNRPAEEREAAAKHILALQGQPAAEPDERSEHQRTVDGIKAYIDSIPSYHERKTVPAVEIPAPAPAPPTPEPSPQQPQRIEITADDFRDARRYYELLGEKADAELAALKRGREA